MIMKKLSFTCLGILLSVCTSCSNSDEEEKDWTGQPSVTISDPVGEKDISITITPENAVAAAYTCIAEGGGSKPTAEEVLEKGIQIDATQPSTIVIDWLDYDTDYVVIAAVRSKEGTVASDTAEITTAKDTAIDLGQGANTYIVSKAGTYSFTPEKVDGTPIDGIASANWIWATKADENDKEQKLLDNVAYAGGKIRFTTTGERGNAVIAAFDATGKSIWVWLIWCTEQPEEMEYENGGVFLDRFLGATAADLTDGEATWGNILYQWGRNVPIYAGYVDEWGEEEVFNEARKWTIMNPELFFFWDVSKSLTSVAGSLAAPTTFFADQKTYNWTVEDQSLWGETKTNYDPCPAGYRLPSEKSWGNFFSDLKILEDESGATYTYKGKTAWYPAMNNGRMFDTGENIKGFAGFTVWNCSYMIADPMGILDMNPPYSVEELIEMGLIISAPQRAYMQYNNTQDVVNAHFAVANPSFAFAVRCVKE